jgi:hypothetical protein
MTHYTELTELLTFGLNTGLLLGFVFFLVSWGISLVLSILKR